MYYNIKIKSNGSEFSLESNNKEVLQREMDLYFATIFNVSEEFKSKIKKIEITNENLKSIKEIDAPKNIEKPINQLTEEKIQELARIRAQEIIEAHKAKIAQEEKLHSQMQSIQATPTIAPNITPINEVNSQISNIPSFSGKLPEQKLEQVENIVAQTPTQIEQFSQPVQEVPTPVVKFQNEPTTPVAQVQPQIQPQAQPSLASQLPDELMELINLAQKKIETIEKIAASDISQTQSTEIKEHFIQKNVKQEVLSEVEQNNQTKLNDIFNISQSQKNEELQNIENASQPSEIIKTPQATESNTFNDPVEISLDDIEVTLQPQEIHEEATFDIITDEEPIQEEIQEETKDETQTSQEISRVPLSQIASQMDFKPFLSGFICDGLSDEFIICAYFIKNVLKQSDFTMKFINSKLFQATGKIADMSVIDELITKEYIRTIDTEDGKKYCITMDGEGYFATKFQG